MKKIGVGILATSLALSMGLGYAEDNFNPVSVSAAEQTIKQFSDIPSDHWARATIDWGVQKGIIKGYNDGTFRPNAEVTEAQFLKMLILSYVSESELSANSNGHWADKYYDYSKSLNYPANGISKIDVRDKAVNREKVAELITSSQGVNYLKDNAITYLLGNDLAKGRTSKTIVGYDGNSTLTRAQAVQFVLNLNLNGNEGISARPSDASDVNALPKIAYELKAVFEQKEIEGLINSLNSFQASGQSQIWHGSEEKMGLDLYGNYSEDMGESEFLSMPLVAISQNDTQNTIMITFYNQFNDLEQQYIKEFLAVYYPTSFEKAFDDIFKAKPGNSIVGSYDNRYFSTGIVGKDKLPVVNIGRD
ncbi:S-layer homology domain-containing protein [Cytobacillus sp. IB215665]|uniref:S-layer homology domain-containing protein n=1 Tax=Cytobacillus sp. IB215665 TaxID=3097357 RepID=UPI002A16A5B3|nr:S-layer homology domain-containing protein [Cytobacillus sp. IB215665]MDX8367185.1 S-layer homology domain-containing protein [Cytobacillus sp. IB215665]